MTPANKHHRGSAVGIWMVCGRLLRGKDSDHADELVRASSLAGNGVDASSHLLAVVNAGKVRPLVLVRRCCSSSCVRVGWQLTSRH